jgi:hypothetical protein
MLQPHFTPSTHWIGGWVGLRADLDTEATALLKMEIYKCRYISQKRNKDIPSEKWRKINGYSIYW